MNTYSTPTIDKEFLSNGNKIPIIIYEMNPMREPNKRINRYRNIFQSESPLINKTQIVFKKSKKNEEKKKAINNYKLYNSIYQKLFLRINYERPQEIKNEKGVIISRHFKSLNVNFKEYPEQKIRSYYLSNKNNSQKRIIVDNNNYINNFKSNFFSTEIKYPLNKNSKNYNSEKIKKYNPISSNHIFSKTSYNFNNINNKLFDVGNYNINNQKKNENFKSQEIPPLLIYGNHNKKS